MTEHVTLGASDEIRFHAAADWQAATGHRLFREIIADTVQEAVFERYLRIEFGFIDTAAAALGAAVARAPRHYYYYADQDAQSPSDEENARNIARLFENGYGDRVLVSHDVFLKMMLTRYGGFGYGYILRHFAPRLRRHGLQDDQIDRLLVANPRAVFT